MAQIVSAVVCDGWRSLIASRYAADTVLLIDKFRIGEGGHDGGSPKEPVTPLANRTDIEADNITKYYFEGNLDQTDITAVTNQITIRCFIDSAQANLNLASNPPEFFELGVYSGSTLIAYSTFPIEIKTVSKSLEHLIIVDF